MMIPLDKNLRNELEKTVKAAREAAEAGAKAALEQLGMGGVTVPDFLDDAQRELWQKLRIHSRQLGDSINGQDKTQSIQMLTEEIAYEHWHRMLFARFLAENNLLMDDDPGSPVALSLEDCEALAAEKNAGSAWELAANYASRMLPQIFRTESPVFQLSLPPEHQQRLEKLLAELPPDLFKASDSLGWVYQFWQAKKKDDVNKSEVKIGARELPAVTQLFTEAYMVQFLLDNSLGAWWAAKRLSEDDLLHAVSEEELREKAAIPGVPLSYLRFTHCNKSFQLLKSQAQVELVTKPDQGEIGEIPDQDGLVTDTGWRIAAGDYKHWAQELKDLKILDPCCGSGHFLVAAFRMLVPMLVDQDLSSPWEASRHILSHQLYGLELDKRCVEIAVFALALAVWTYPGATGYRPLPQMNIACCGLSVGAAKEEWTALANGNAALRQSLTWLYDFYQDAPLLGSLLNPKADKFGEFIRTNYPEYAFDKLLTKVRPDAEQEAGLAAKGLLDATLILMNEYDLVITNVPYLARGKQDKTLQDYCEKHFPAAKNDLATVFLDRCLQLCREGGTASIVLPQNWLFLTSYRKFREKLLKGDTWQMIARLGPQAFQTPMWDFNVQLLLLSKGQPDSATDIYNEKGFANTISGLDVSEFRSAAEKGEKLIDAELKVVSQMRQLKNPGSIVSIENLSSSSLLEEFASSNTGLQTGDNDRFFFVFWELDTVSHPWIFNQRTSDTVSHFKGLYQILRWGSEGNELKNQSGAVIRGIGCIGSKGLLLHRMSFLPVTIYTGESFDQNGVVILPNSFHNLPSIWSFVSSKEYNIEVRKLDNKVGVAPATLVKVPFDIDHWQKVATDNYPHGLPQPYSDDPTQWIFHGHPCGSVIWSEQRKQLEIGAKRKESTVLQIAIARLLGYQWPAESDPGMELSKQSRSLVLDAVNLNGFADSDGIVCISSVGGEESAVDRITKLLAAAYQEHWSPSIWDALMASSQHAEKSRESWLRDKFFAQHCKLFQHRPFIWQIWDGLRDGFSALVNYHSFDNRKLQSLIYRYLGDWILQQRQALDSGVDGSAEKLAAAENLQKRLILILEGDAPYDIFVRWKSLPEQAIGWSPDLNDGVRMNIRPFVKAEVLRYNKKSVLNLNWDKDRGKDVPSAPWYQLDNGDRINDRHLTLREKKEARHAET